MAEKAKREMATATAQWRNTPGVLLWEGAGVACLAEGIFFTMRATYSSTQAYLLGKSIGVEHNTK